MAISESKSRLGWLTYRRLSQRSDWQAGSSRRRETHQQGGIHMVVNVVENRPETTYHTLCGKEISLLSAAHAKLLGVLPEPGENLGKPCKKCMRHL